MERVATHRVDNWNIIEPVLYARITALTLISVSCYYQVNIVSNQM